MLNNLFNIKPTNPMEIRKSNGYLILAEIFEGKKIEGPLSQIFYQLLNQYINKKINEEQFIKNVIRYKVKYDRYLITVNHIYFEICRRRNLKPNLDFRSKLFPAINETFGLIIGKYVHNQDYSLENFKKDFKTQIMMRDRKIMVNMLLDKMSDHSDFKNLPNNIGVYFNNYLNRYLNDLSYTLPELLYQMENKHNMIIKNLHKHT